MKGQNEPKKESNVCKWWQSHQWSKWKIVGKGRANGWPTICQQRTCQRCGYVQNNSQVA